ncbi:hypothetical protein [Undibacterium umbellatum]|uniref:Uncharacterized protein n=1 Tax=Undibacterium umbellatum TaxID=2762300 RepID=A0ABR6Z6U2_9BURK|nr:hypothetical protein [Undibacterium umbellatum]MBC3907334.1 hypothetical protein [Undibacterium umbellatum]
MTPGPYLIKNCDSCEQLLRYVTLASRFVFFGAYWTDGYDEIFHVIDNECVGLCPSCGKAIWREHLHELGMADSFTFHTDTRTEFEVRIPTVNISTVLLMKIVREVSKCSFAEAKTIVSRHEIHLNPLFDRDDAYDYARKRLQALNVPYVVIEHIVPVQKDFPEEWLKALPPVRIFTAKKYQEILQESASLLDTEQEKFLRKMIMQRDNDLYRQSDATSEWLLTEETRLNLNKLSAILDETNIDERLLKAEIARNLGHFDASLALLDCDYENYVPIINFLRNHAQNHMPALSLFP